MVTPKHKVGTKLYRSGHIPITIIGIDGNRYLCEQTNYTDNKLSLSFDFLDEVCWINQNPIWLTQKK